MDDFYFSNIPPEKTRKPYEIEGVCLLKTFNIPEVELVEWINRVRTISKQDVIYRYEGKQIAVCGLGNIKKVQDAMFQCKKEMDSLFKKHNPEIKETPFIIIDDIDYSAKV